MIGWRAHLGVIFPTPVPGRVIREFYEVVPEGVDVTTTSLTVRQLSAEDLDAAAEGVERSAEQLSRYDIDFVYQQGVPPLVRKAPGFYRELTAKMEKASGKPSCTDLGGVIEAFKDLGVRRPVMVTPFRDDMNEMIKHHLAAEEIHVAHMKGLQIVNNVEIRRLAIPVEYTCAREAFRESPVTPDCIYVPCGGWGTVHNIQRLEQDFGVPVVTWFQAMIWWTLKRAGIKAPIQGFGRLLGGLGG